MKSRLEFAIYTMVILAVFAGLNTISPPEAKASHRDFSSMPVRAGRISLSILDVKATVTFTSPMTSTNYALSLAGPIGIGQSLFHSNKTTTGFDLYLGGAAVIAGGVDYIATLHQ